MRCKKLNSSAQSGSDDLASRCHVLPISNLNTSTGATLGVCAHNKKWIRCPFHQWSKQGAGNRKPTQQVIGYYSSIWRHFRDLNCRSSHQHKFPTLPYSPKSHHIVYTSRACGNPNHGANLLVQASDYKGRPVSPVFENTKRHWHHRYLALHVRDKGEPQSSQNAKQDQQSTSVDEPPFQLIRPSWTDYESYIVLWRKNRQKKNQVEDIAF